MALITTRMVPGGHLQSVDVKQYADLLLGTMTDQPVALGNTLSVQGKPVTISPDASNTLEWRANGLFTVGGGGGEQAADTEEFLPAAAATTVTLSRVPADVWLVTRDGLVQSAADGHWSLAGSVITFSDAFSGTERVLVTYAFGTVGAVGPAGPAGPAGPTGPAGSDATIAPWSVATSHLTVTPDNAYDIGASGATRPRTLYLGTSVISPMVNTPLLSPTGNVVEQRNGVVGQTLRIYNSYTDASNYERLRLNIASGTFYVATEAAGTGASRQLAVGTIGASNLLFVTSGAGRWVITSTGTLQAQSDGTLDIGVSGSNRPRDLYLSGQVSLGASTAYMKKGDTTTTLAFSGGLQPPGNGQGNLGEAHLKWSSLFLTGAMVSNNWEMIGSNPRLFGPMRWATPSGEFYMMNAYVNDSTWLNARPNGTGVGSGWRAFKDFAADNSPYALFGIDNLGVGIIDSNKLGTGVAGPLSIRTAGAERLRIETSGQVDIGASFLRVMGWHSVGVTSGAGLELGYEAGIPTSHILSYDRGASQFKDLQIQAKNIQFVNQAGGVLSLPSGSVTTPMLAAEAVNKQFAVYNAVASFSTTTLTTWLATPVSVSFTAAGSGYIMRIEGWMTCQHSVAGGSWYVGIGIDGAVQIYINQTLSAVSQQPIQSSWTYYIQMAAGAHQVTMYVFNNTAGTLAINGAISSYLSVTEQKR